MRFSFLVFTVTMRAVCLISALVGLSSQAHAYIHPCIPATLDDLATIKASLNQQPWKKGYALLAADSHSQLTYTMQGPFATVTRNPNSNLGQWRNDMTAVWDLARMWYFTGNSAYAQKAHDILIAWATTQTSFGGQESGLDLGDYAFRFVGGADILRGTWPGWTTADTITVKNYFLNVLWPGTAAGGNAPGEANKGLLNLEAGIAIAAFCDDTDKFNHVVDQYRTYPGAGLVNALPIGEMGETGRDAGHLYGGLLGMAFISEVAWKQGVDLYSELDNRLLACGEYCARNTLATDNPFVPFGTVDYTYYANVSVPYAANRSALYFIQNAYKNRFHLPTPWIDRKLQHQNVDTDNWMYAKTADSTTATPLAAIVRPAVSLASSGLTLTTLGTQTAGRSVSYSNGTWTMTGLGNGVWSDTSDDCQFAYQTMTGDCALVAKVTSCTYSGNSNCHAGLMIRNNLSATVSQRGWIGIIPYSGTNQMESRQTGWTETWGGTGWASRSNPLPPNIPYWIKIERRGNQVTTYSSQDGTSWAAIESSYYGNLPSSMNIGLFVSSGTTTTTTATFTNVAFTGGTGGLVTTPAPPAAVFAVGSSKAITVRWLPSFGATAYDLFRSTTSGTSYAALASNLSASTTSYVDTTAASGTTYYYVVQAKNSAGSSGNSPQFGDSRITSPMANLAFSGTTLASINTGSQVGGSDDAFTGDPGSKWYCYNSPTGWIQYDFGANNAQVVKRYTINSADVPSRDPKDWTFLGSQDGSNWTTLDSQTGQSFSIPMWQNTYNIANTTAYRYYRLNITADNGATGVAIGDMGLWGDSGRTIPDGTYRLSCRKSNKVVDVTGTATTNGALLMQSGWNGGDSQKWTLAWQGNGQYRATGVASSKVIDNGGTSSTGANLAIQPWSGASSQLWTIVPDSDGFYHFTSGNSGLAADVSGGSTSDGANIIQWTYSGADNQLWTPSIGSTPTPIPSAPTGLAATASSISQINLSWTASSGAIGYRIKRATVSGGPYTALSTEVNATSWSDTGLSDSTTYYYVVSAINGSGESADSAQASATTLTAPPPAPTGVTEILGTHQVALSWAATGGATSYIVKRATTSGGPYTTLATGLTGTTYTDTTIAIGVAYYYVVEAVNSNGASTDSAEVSTGQGGLSVYLKFDETGGSIAADSSGGGHDATLFQGPTFGPGFLSNALNFPATNSQYAGLPSGIASGLTDFTIATWVKLSGTLNNTRIFDFGTGTGNYMELCPKNGQNGYLRYEIASGAVQQINTTYTFPTGVWTHVAITQSGSTGTLYINGTAVGTNTSLTLNPSKLGVTTQNNLGKSQWGTDPYLNGALDDFRLYSQALSPAQIAALANPSAGAPLQLAAFPDDTQAVLTWGPNATNTYTVKRSTTSGGPYAIVADGVTDTTYTDTGLTNGVTYYYVVSGSNAQGYGPNAAEVSVTPNTLGLYLKFDETSGTIAADSSGRYSPRNATLVNAPTFATGKLGNALSLTGSSSQYATLPSGIVSNLTNFTVCTWVKANSITNWQRIFDFGTSSTNYMFLTTQYAGSTGKLRFGIRVNNATEQAVSGTNIALTTGTWTHVAVARSGSNVSLYVNGALAGSGTIANNPSDLGTTTLNYLGKSQVSQDPYLDGALDDFRLYSQALSPSDIALIASPLAAPQNFAATTGPLSLNLTWNAVPNATAYTVQVSTVSGGPYVTLASSLSGTSLLHSGLNHGTIYYYVVSAANSLYQSPLSAELAATPDSALLSKAETLAPSFVITPATETSTATITVTTATSVPGHKYQLQTCTDLTAGQWSDLDDPVFGNGSAIVIQEPYDSIQPRRFYRLFITR